MPNLLRHFKVLLACDEVCVKMMGRSNRDTWWWNIVVKKAVSRKKDARKAMFWDSTEKNKRMYRCIKNNAKNAVLRSMRENA